MKAASGERVAGNGSAALLTLSVFAALSRLLAVAKSPWDWDELLFMLAVRRYDVVAHHPHPPGFPLFIGAAKLLSFLGDFRALQLIDVAASMLIVPAMFALCRALGMRESTSLTAAALLVFAPNVWFYGGTAMSDVPSMLLVVAALALIVRGFDDERAYIAGAIVLAVAAGVRPQNLIIGCIPMIIATLRQRRRAIVIAALAMIVIMGGSYDAVIAMTGWRAYRDAIAAHEHYIRSVDSYLSAGRPPLWELFDDFFVWPYRAPLINVAITALVAISALVSLPRARRPVLLMLAAFAPFCLFAWLFLDRHSVSRFSIGYAPLIALMAADGLAVVARRPRFEAVGAAIVVAMMIVWTWPALTVVRTTIAPPVAAMQAVRPGCDRVVADQPMSAFAEYYLTDCRTDTIPRGAALATALGSTVVVREGAGSRTFAREHGRLWNLARRRYFEVSGAPALPIAFGDGWYEEERSGAEVWRWMGSRCVMHVPPMRGQATLWLELYVPLDALPPSPVVTITADGRLLDRVVMTKATLAREWPVDAPREIVIETDRVAVPRKDARPLGVRLNAVAVVSR